MNVLSKILESVREKSEENIDARKGLIKYGITQQVNENQSHKTAAVANKIVIIKGSNYNIRRNKKDT